MIGDGVVGMVSGRKVASGTDSLHLLRLRMGERWKEILLVLLRLYQRLFGLFSTVANSNGCCRAYLPILMGFDRF